MQLTRGSVSIIVSSVLIRISNSMRVTERWWIFQSSHTTASRLNNSARLSLSWNVRKWFVAFISLSIFHLIDSVWHYVEWAQAEVLYLTLTLASRGSDLIYRRCYVTKGWKQHGGQGVIFVEWQLLIYEPIGIVCSFWQSWYKAGASPRGDTGLRHRSHRLSLFIHLRTASSRHWPSWSAPCYKALACCLVDWISSC